jgi:hypothetical protein
MKPSEVHTLLGTLVELDPRIRVTPATADVWHPILVSTDLADAIEGARQHYATADPNRMLVGDVRICAQAVANRRARTEEIARGRALAAAPVTLGPRGLAAREEFRRLAAKLGNLDRKPARMRPDPTSPTSPDSGVTEAARREALARLAAMAAA